MKWIPKREPGDPTYKYFSGEMRDERDAVIDELRATARALVQSQQEHHRLTAEVYRLTQRVSELTQIEHRYTASQEADQARTEASSVDTFETEHTTD